jgi:hypothetical protein
VQIASGPFSLPDAESARPDVAPAPLKDEGSAEGSGATAPVPPLPCLFRNNSDKAAEFLTAAQRKTAHAIYMNVMAFVILHGFENCGFFTVTFPDHLTWQEAQRRLNNYMRRVLGPMFADRIKVLEFTKSGRPHYHMIVACGADIRTGFNFDYLADVLLWNQYLKRAGQPKPQGTLNRNSLLVSLHDRLNATGGKYGVGRMELVPLKSCAEAVGRYVGGYLKKSVGGRKPEHKGARFVSYSRGFERAYKGNFTWVEGGREWRRKVAIFAAKHGCNSMPELRALFGSKWAYHHGDNIRQITLPHEQTTQTQIEPSTPFASIDDLVLSTTGRSVFGSHPGDRGGTAAGASFSDWGRELPRDAREPRSDVDLAAQHGERVSESALVGAPANAASTEHESTRQGAPSDALRRCSPPSQNPATNQEGSGGRRYTLGKRTMLPVHPRLYFQRRLQI